MTRFASFDLEIARPVVDNNWRGNGISCAVCVLSDVPNALVWQGQPELGKHGAMAVAEALDVLLSDGYTLVTFNGAGFDLKVLADECGPRHDYAAWFAEMARGHIDMFFDLFCRLGYGPGLNALAKGMGLGGKTEGVDGAMAPDMWQSGRYQEVIDYCIQDTRLTLQVAQAVIERGAAEWTSKSGKPQRVEIDHWLTPAQAVQLLEPDNSWMGDRAWPRSKFVGWCGL